MNIKLSHVTFWVTNQEEAKRFYTEKLGFEVRTDVTMDNGFRWLTVGPKEQPDLEIVLMEPKPSPMIDSETAEQIRTLVRKGAFGGAAFHTPDCRQTYEELTKRGVQFSGPPEEKFYGVETLMRDNSGNWFSMTQPNPEYEPASSGSGRKTQV
jgi:catechol 2,3-dioxygenase-like lactoylglutathione lyase family enzyme